MIAAAPSVCSGTVPSREGYEPKRKVPAQASGFAGGRDVASDFSMNACLALGISLLFAAPAFAQTHPANRPPVPPPLKVSRLSTSGDYAIYGHGNSSCSAWSATQPGTPARDLFLAWVQGFLTGTGGFNDEQRKTDTEGIQASMTTYCHAHPTDTIEVAASTLFVSLIGVQSASAQESPALFITPAADNLEAFLSAAMTNKQVPVTVVAREERATLVLTASAATVQQQSAGARFARCLVASCGSTKDRGTTHVQLVKGDTVVWSYSVNKGRGEKNRQSLAEAIASHLKADYFHK
jgi:hypothetical protein